MARRGRPPKEVKEPDKNKARETVDKMMAIIHTKPAEDINGHQIAIQYGRLSELVEQLDKEID